MRVLVTGGAGFIGRYVALELVSRGHEPVIFDHRGRTSDGYESHLGDIRDPTAVTEAFAHASAFVHLAGILGTQETVANPRPSAETNVLGGINVLEAAAQYKLPGVYIGVGNHWMQNTYSITKTTVERFCAMYNAERGTRVNVVRAVNAYGPHQRAAKPFAAGAVRKIVPAFACRALCGLPIEVYGDGQQVSDMAHVTDVARALVLSLEAAAEGRVYDQAIEVGPADHNTVNDVAHLIARLAEDLTGKFVDIIHLPMRPGEVAGDSVTADQKLADRVLGPHYRFVPLADGMGETVRWFQANKGVTWNAPEY